MQRTKPVGISFPKELLNWIDTTRGRVSRSRFITDILRDVKRTHKKKEDEYGGNP